METRRQCGKYLQTKQIDGWKRFMCKTDDCPDDLATLHEDFIVHICLVDHDENGKISSRLVWSSSYKDEASDERDHEG